MVNETIGLKELIYEIQSKQLAVFQLQKNISILKYIMLPTDVKQTLLKINDFFCNVTSDKKLVLVNDIKGETIVN